jgi:hypothetical protein
MIAPFERNIRPGSRRVAMEHASIAAHQRMQRTNYDVAHERRAGASCRMRTG